VVRRTTTAISCDAADEVLTLAAPRVEQDFSSASEAVYVPTIRFCNSGDEGRPEQAARL
jgi:hypothetical protein